jgi:two-component system NtrC family sensor kinase
MTNGVGLGSTAHEGPLELLNLLRQEERRAAVSRVASTLSHALGTPLNVISGRAAMINMEGVSVDEMRSNARIIEQQVRSVANMLRTVLSFAREGKPELETRDARKVVERAVQTLEPIARARGVRLLLEEGPGMDTRLRESAVLQVLANLIALGVYREPEGGSVGLALRLEHAEPPQGERGRVPPGEYLRFSVTYGSLELPPALFDVVYEPWLTPQCADREAALILALSYGVAREHRGWVEAHLEPGSSSLVLNWPRMSTA